MPRGSRTTNPLWRPSAAIRATRHANTTHVREPRGAARGLLQHLVGPRGRGALADAPRLLGARVDGCGVLARAVWALPIKTSEV
ncbi:hypothetical protein TruAng_000250 [Truncatella angustata]|nr:hypothetical protein TruAng_000250 [Truncatella angustata]